ncbi:sensor histidine kinase [Paenibacillus popilliae]|uniref:histidine kinase n=1 Tax=Paenibacillus popilliae ATCC 14706 TaxID=1212764 RepID=M9LCB6_PAEPP|nr:HAMP domain-containing sensor histidine kinase [Paenibacillus popilliae]GAC43677.1 signal transduction histidine kinase [Paenibacillus popilliae ATCC 14706]
MKLRTLVLFSYLSSLIIVTLILFVAYKQMFLDYDRLRIAMMITVSSSVLSLLINSLFIFPMARHITLLNKQSQDIARGHYDQLLNNSRVVELRELAESMHKMGLEIKAKIKALQDEERRRNELIANLSHDIKTPIASIRSYWEALVDEEVTDPTEVRNYLLGIGKQTERVVSFANELLAIASIDDKEIAFKPEVVWIDQLILDTLQAFEAQISRENRVIDVNISKDCVSVRTDNVCIQRILYNLVGNAIKFSKPGTSIKLYIYCDDTYTYIEVKDEGIGIPQDEMDKIFERFYRVEKSRNQQYGGSGLGLAIAKELTEFIHGRLTVTSGQGIGSIFIIQIPNEIGSEFELNENSYFTK